MLALKQTEESKGKNELYNSCIDDKPEESQVVKNMKCKPDANSDVAIGSPLQASSPSKTDDAPLIAGDGDGHSLRSIHNLLSPIHSLKGRNQMNNAMIESPSSSSPNPSQSSTPATMDSFLTNFGKSTSAKSSMTPNSLEKELLLSEKVSKMDDGEAKKLLTRVLIDNMGLRQELRTKEKRITAYKGQMLAILDWKVRQECDDEITGKSRNESPNKSFVRNENVEMKTQRNERDSEKNMTPQKTINSLHEITMVEEVYGIRRSLSFIQDLASSIDVDHELLKDRLKDGYYLTNQLLIGGLAGWVSALFLKKFGKLALSATGGGILLLVYTTRKGFVNVNYESIYQEISKICDTKDDSVMNDDSYEDAVTGSDTSVLPNCGESFSKSRDNLLRGGIDASKSNELNQICTYDRIRHAKNWIRSHTYTVGGFVISFVYNLL